MNRVKTIKRARRSVERESTCYASEYSTSLTSTRGLITKSAPEPELFMLGPLHASLLEVPYDALG